MSFITLRQRPRPAPEPDKPAPRTATQSVATRIAPPYVQRARDHVRLGQAQVAQTLALMGWPRQLRWGWLQPITDAPMPLELAVHLWPQGRRQLKRDLGHRRTGIGADRLHALKGGTEMASDSELAYYDVTRFKDALEANVEDGWKVSIYCTIRRLPSAPARAAAPWWQPWKRWQGSNGLGELDQPADELRLTWDDARLLTFEHDQGVIATQPLARDPVREQRLVDTTTAAYTLPLSAISTGLEPAGAQADHWRPGVFLGVGAGLGLVEMDLHNAAHDNQFCVLAAPQGAGKSYLVKCYVSRLFLRGVDCWLIDQHPSEEYLAMCQRLGGTYLRFAPGGRRWHVNPFDLAPEGTTTDDRDPLAEQIAQVRALVTIMLAPAGSHLDPLEVAVLDGAIRDTYAAAGITDDPDTHGRTVPLMADLLALLERHDAGTLERQLAIRLSLWVRGSMKGLFDGPTNVDFAEPLLVFNIAHVAEDLRPALLYLLNLAIWRAIRQHPKPRLLVADEAWRLLQTADGAALLSALARTGRQYDLALLFLTQFLEDFLRSDAGKTVWHGASHRILLKQRVEELNAVRDTVQLSEAERQILLAAEKGEGLLTIQGDKDQPSKTVQFQVMASKAEDAMATTAPSETRVLRAAALLPSRNGHGR